MSETALKDLKNKKKQLKASLTRFNTYFTTLTQTSNLIEAKKRLNVAEHYLSQFMDIQNQIELLEEADSHEEERIEFENTYFQVIGKVEQFLLDNETKTDAPQSQNNAQTQSNQSGEQNQFNHIRLPTIKLPTFSGAYDEWFSYHDTFLSLIHSNGNLTDIQRFHYLKASLQGEAASVISSLEITSQNYGEAWEIVKERFSNKRLIIQKHIRDIFELPIAHKENASILRQILDGALKHLRALKALQRPTDSWDDLLIHLISSKLDPHTNKEWEASISKSDIPPFKQMTDFLLHKCETLEIISRKFFSSSPSKFFSNKSSLSHVVTQKPSCAICKTNHLIYHCKTFLQMSIEKRLQTAKAKNLCINCLKHGHQSSKCASGSCKECGKRHNTLLHFPVQQKQENQEDSAANEAATVSAHASEGISQIFLSTAIVKIIDYRNKSHECRALLDSGSQSNFITKDLTKRLNLSLNPASVPIMGINKVKSHISHCVTVGISSTYNAFRTNLKCLVLENIAGSIPQSSVEKSRFSIPKNLKLADPNFNVSNKVDLLIGAETFWTLLCVGQIKMSINQPYLQKTHLGWIVAGKLLKSIQESRSTFCNLSLEHKLEANLTRFWEIEECPRKPALTMDEKACEADFESTVRRHEDGRFIVQLPLKINETALGESRNNAIKRLYSLEKKLARQPQLKAEYDDFMREYLNLNHMAKINKQETTSSAEINYYLPHHAVIKEDSLTTRLRVVFDGSAKSTNGKSLNDVLMVGPNLQDDIFSIVMRFRMYKYVITADIAKMYRQVLVDKSQTRLQRIVWRFNPNDSIEDYELLTVTYGTASASYLAIKALQWLALEEVERYPVGSSIILNDFYVDDLLTGANTVEEAKAIITEVSTLLQEGGFQLRKWSSNHPLLLEVAPNSLREAAILNIANDEIKTLGLQWNSCLDVIQYRLPLSRGFNKITKRTILSKTSQLFDPLGLVSPVIITAKIMIQKLWLLKLDWDESVPFDVHSAWTQFETQLEYLKNIKIPRQVTSNNISKLEICGFCDASERAYGACIYIRSVSSDDDITSKLLCSKSRIAPVKCISLPRLELCGALLLAQLVEKVSSSIKRSIQSIRLWTDSTIVLSWIRSSSNRWKTFVSNRVSEIQTLTKVENWKHVKTTDNPADLVSRGVSPEQLAMCKMWWEGPSWLSKNESHFPTQTIIHDQEIDQTHLEIRNTPYVQILVSQNSFNIFERYSNLSKLTRIVAYCIRFKRNLSAKVKGISLESFSGSLKTFELNHANKTLLKLVQSEVFGAELEKLRKNKPLSSKSKLLCLNPFLDDDGLIRAGGRIQHSSLSHERKHQIILPANHTFTKLMIEQEHRRQLHAGVQQTIASIRTKYWPLAARGTVRHILRKCIPCFKANPKPAEYIMGNLPLSRVEPARPFMNAGVDYCGPFLIRGSTKRNSRIERAYASVFVCFATKAIHIELVSSLSSEAFLSALKRFIARRGHPLLVYSDNATNFVGANKELQRLHKLFENSEQEMILKYLSDRNIQWHFIPARSPHFGGLWEAAVKSVKNHLKRIAGNAHLSFEELYTLFTQIEAVLNSRPLTPLSDDPNDPSFLTPGHFLIGESLTDILEPNLTGLKLNRLSRWQHLQQLKQHFWTRWSREYLNQLQERSKWRKDLGPTLQRGNLVIIKEDSTPPHLWISARVVEVHPGLDGTIRAATVRTSTGMTKRAANKLCVVPINANE